MDMDQLVKSLTIIETKPGDLVVLTPGRALTEAEFRGLRETFQSAMKERPTLKEVLFLFNEAALDVRKMPEGDQRVLLDHLCSALGLRVVPL